MGLTGRSRTRESKPYGYIGPVMGRNEEVRIRQPIHGVTHLTLSALAGTYAHTLQDFPS